MQLVIGNKNYSSWSMRPWVLMRALGLPFEERMLRFDFHDANSRFSAEAAKLSPTARVPVLLEADGFAVWDSLAMAERLHECFPNAGVWPADPRQRARARSLCASMHSGFGKLRSLCPMNIEADLRDIGRQLVAQEPGLRADLQQLEALWLPELTAHGGPWLFGAAFCAADAFFAPVAMRVKGYGLPLAPPAQAYVEALSQQSAVQEWVQAALGEHHWVPEDEPYRQGPSSGQL
ncbi:MAG: glutathione S-transferase [Burkholderiales bacterium]|uniref:glutathione S-transferase n=1 Tax=Inhella sp. TaxID=1921806 RepID=UPI001ACE9F58|nr:glutathione S-transferase [Burkholderiales bacterium]